MSLATGSRLGPYEVLGPLGAGGMGEVYRARDTKLDRDVAIKVLPELFARIPSDWLASTREAQDARRAEPSEHRAHPRTRRVERPRARW